MAVTEESCNQMLTSVFYVKELYFKWGLEAHMESSKTYGVMEDFYVDF